LGVITSAIALFALGRVGAHTTIDEALGMIIIEAGVVAIGFSVGTAQLGGGNNEDTGMGPRREEPRVRGQLVIAFCGAVLFGANVAPTEEILMIGMETSAERLLLLCVVSIALGGLILYFSGFARAHHYSRIETKGEAFSGMIVNYAVALIASAVILWFFGRFESHSLGVCIQQVIVLGFPATLGAAAGRLLLQT
jgi:putative integral membrane protein (TIGR02587 family)